MRSSARRSLGAAALLLGALGGLGYLALRRPPRTPDEPALSVAETLRTGGPGADAGYSRALAPRPFSFPEDHGSHPGFRTEWWYFTGNLAAAGGERYGYQLTLFRSALAPADAARPSAWGTRQGWLGHLALGDARRGTFRAFERWGRESLGLAGARAEPLRIWLRDWSAEGLGPGGFPLRLRAAANEDGGYGLDLRLDEGKAPVLQGDRGLSRKSAEPGNASYYYSLPRMPTRGELTLAGRRVAVSGLSWMDREWSTSSLGRGQVGWDWFALQLDDGRELMLYRLRRADGSPDPASTGTLIERDGRTRSLAAAEASIDVLDRWTSPDSGARYPAAWRIRIPAAGLDLRVVPLLAGQELRLSFRYWEGAVRVTGTAEGARPLNGRGFVELTGYNPPGG